MMDFIKNRKFRILAACISLLLLMNMIQDTYAKYVSSASANSNFTIAKWSFLVNEQDVLSNSDFTNTITPSFDTNEHIKDGVICPTSIGFFDITIDSSLVDVSFDEIITLSNGDNNTITDLVFTGYRLNDGDLVNLETNTITTHHLLNEENTVNTYRIYIEWKDGANETMNNELDTAATIDGIASIKVNVQFIQTVN